MCNLFEKNSMRKSLIIIGAVFLSFVMLANIYYAHESTKYLCIIDDSVNEAQVAQFTTTVLLPGDVNAEFNTSSALNDNSYGNMDGADYSDGRAARFTNL